MLEWLPFGADAILPSHRVQGSCVGGACLQRRVTGHNKNIKSGWANPKTQEITSDLGLGVGFWSSFKVARMFFTQYGVSIGLWQKQAQFS